MGNSIAVSDTKLDLDAVVSAASEAGPTGPSEKRKKFASVLVAWKIKVSDSIAGNEPRTRCSRGGARLRSLGRVVVLMTAGEKKKKRG